MKMMLIKYQRYEKRYPMYEIETQGMKKKIPKV
jgi:hypothetical protein